MTRGKTTTPYTIEGNDDASVQQVDQNVQLLTVDAQRPVKYISKADFEVLMKELMDKH